MAENEYSNSTVITASLIKLQLENKFQLILPKEKKYAEEKY